MTTHSEDAGPAGDAGPADAEPDAGFLVDAGHRPDAGAEVDAGHEPDMGYAPDAEPEDAGPPDMGEHPDAEPVDLGTPDSGEHPDAEPPDMGPPDLGVPDAGIDAGLPDSGVSPDSGVPPDGGLVDGGAPDSGVPGYYDITVVGRAGVFVNVGNSIGTCNNTDPVGVCTMQVEHGAHISVMGNLSGHCFNGQMRAECGDIAGFICTDYLYPLFFSECFGMVTGPAVFSYTEFYDGALSVCPTPAPGCPTNVQCGRYGTTSCGACPTGEACVGDGYSLTCLPLNCPP